MAFTPIRLRHSDGREYVAGSAIEREQLLTRGYRVIRDETPALADGVAESDAKPDPRPAKPAPKPTDK